MPNAKSMKTSKPGGLDLRRIAGAKAMQETLGVGNVSRMDKLNLKRIKEDKMLTPDASQRNTPRASQSPKRLPVKKISRSMHFHTHWGLSVGVGHRPAQGPSAPSDHVSAPL